MVDWTNRFIASPPTSEQQSNRQSVEAVSKLRDLQKRYAIIGDVRGRGLMVGAELIGEPSDATAENTDEVEGGVSIGRDLFPGRNVARRDAIVQLAFKKGLLLLGCGRSALRFSVGFTACRHHRATAEPLTSRSNFGS